MRLGKILICLILMCAMLLTSSLSAHAVTTQLNESTLAVPIQDAKVATAYCAAIEAQLAEINASVAQERITWDTLEKHYQAYTGGLVEENRLLKLNNDELTEQTKLLRKQVRLAENSKILWLVGGIVLGGVAGYLTGH